MNLSRTIPTTWYTLLAVSFAASLFGSTVLIGIDSLWVARPMSRFTGDTLELGLALSALCLGFRRIAFPAGKRFGWRDALSLVNMVFLAYCMYMLGQIARSV